MPRSWGPWDPGWEDGGAPGVWRGGLAPLIYMLIVSAANDAYFDPSAPARKTPGFFWCVSTHLVNSSADIDADYKPDTSTGTASTLGAAKKAAKDAANSLERSLKDQGVMS
jgi:hypothetical protein